MFVLCLAGLGSRFIDVGIHRPKYLLPTKSGLPILSSIIKQVSFPGNELVMLVLNNRHTSYQSEVVSALKKTTNNYSLHYIDDTSGQAETAKIGAKLALAEFPESSGKPILFHNGDTILLNRNIKAYIRTLKRADGIIDTFHNEGPNYSYVTFIRDKVTSIKEKSVISDHASTGLYGFKSPEYYLDSYYESRFNGEQYISSVYEYLLNHNAYIINKHVKNLEDTIVLGTPEEYQSYMDA
jgi:dTDP-glucose pyrophosphorylase